MESSERVTARFRAAVEASDADGVIATLAPDVVLHSPITERVKFRGPAEVRELLLSVFEAISDIRYSADVGDDRTRALFYRAHVNGTPVEEATRIELDEQGRIREITLFFRPLPGLATVTAELGPRVTARRHGRLRSILARLLLAPLGFVTRAGDRVVTWFA